MTLDLLSMLVGVVFSLAFSYFPWVKDWFEALEPNQKRLVNIGAAVLVAGVILGLSCLELVDYLTCDVKGVLLAVRVVIDFVIANQAAYSLTPKKY